MAVLASALLASLLALSACGSGDDASGDAKQAKADGGKRQTIGILMNGPLTGTSAEIGTDLCNGAKLAAADVNAAGGVKSGPLAGSTFEIECADNPDFSTDAAATIATRFLSDEKLWVSAGYASSAEALAAAKVVERDGLAVIASTVGAEFLTQESNNIVALFPDTRGLGYASTDFCQKYYGGKTIAQATAAYSYMDSYLAGEKVALGDTGIKLVMDKKYKPGAVTDFSDFVAQMKQSNPDCVFTGDYPPVMEKMIVEARKTGFNAPFIDFGAAGVTVTGLKTTGKDGLGTIYASFAPTADEASAEFKKVDEAWQAKYNKPLGYYPAYGYDTVLAVKYAIEAGATSRKQLLDKFRGVDGPGIVGQIKFNNDLRIAERPLYFLEQTGTAITDLELVGTYTLEPDGSAKAVKTLECGDRPSCQTNRASG